MGLDGEAGEAEDGGDAWMGEALWPRQALKEYFELLTALQENMREYEDLQVRDAARPRRPKRPAETAPSQLWPNVVAGTAAGSPDVWMRQAMATSVLVEIPTAPDSSEDADRKKRRRRKPKHVR